MELLLFTSLLFLSLSLPFSSLSLNQDGLFLQQAKLGLADPTHSLSSWSDRDDTPCDWYGITCDPSTHRVTSIDLSNSLLSGSFPTFLCRLTLLSYLDLSNNSISSALTVDHFSTCQNLQALNLSSNLFVGPIPDSLPRHLPNLRQLVLLGNNFSGPIPPQFGQFQRLEILNLAGNLLSGPIPEELGNISTLKQLLLGYNPFQPTQIPSHLGNLTNLEYLWLASLNLEGPIPSTIGQLYKLQTLDFTFNQLSGRIPTSLTQLKSAVLIELYNNTLSGPLPPGFSNLTQLREFDASTNQLTGSIPADLCELHLSSLNLMENRLEGTIPESIANSPNLYELKLFNNNITGELPSQLGLNSPLQYLDVSYTGLSGKIPENLCAKGELENIIMIFSNFSGLIPEGLAICNSLVRIRLKHNQLSGVVPKDLWGLPRVSLLELEDNLFVGEISKIIGSAHNLSVLKISNNQFSGSIPVEVGSLRSLIEFSANGNGFTGPIPGSLVKLGMLGRLALNDNDLSGGLPLGIQGWKSLNELNLASNNLSGSIPDEIGSLTVLNYLDLSCNHFTGEIPFQLQNLNLNLLNLSNNRLTGKLPPLFAKEIYRNSFLGNAALCGDMEDLCSQTDDSKKQRYNWILTSIFIFAGLVLIVGVGWFYFKYKIVKKAKKGIITSKWRSFHKLGFSEFEIADCLKEENVIGSGASGKVYKVALGNGEMVAVKKLSGESKEDGDSTSVKDEFEAEVETLGKIRHKNIVRLWCCCKTGDCRLLVYEYMPNGSLGDLLHSNKGSLLGWPTRYKIALDAAEGLSYLHNDCVPPIVHRDVKSNNILLDQEFRARVADFGVAKVFQGVNKRTESMSVIAGSCGYIAPEYAYTLRVNEKSDIYSFGVVILELVTGRLPIDPEFGERDLVKWVCATLAQNRLDHAIDPNLDSQHKDEISMVLEIGLRCTSPLPINRPPMRRVVKMLQEVGGESKPKSNKDGKLSPYYQEEAVENPGF